jgi:hypothetical protein
MARPREASKGAGTLVLINTTSFSAASSVSLDNIFTSTYDNYRCVIRLTSSATNELRWRGRTSGTDNTTTNYVFQIMEAFSSSIGASRSSGATYGYAGYTETGPTNSYILEFIEPKATQSTCVFSTTLRNYSTTSPVLMFINNGFNATTSFDGVSIYPGSGTLTGTIQVYGYRK